MNLLLNILWATLGGGFLIAAQYAIGGVVLCLTVVGIPFGVQCFKLAHLSLLPFGRDVEDDPASTGSGLLGLTMNLIWMIFGGVTTFLSHLTLALGSAVTIIGLPFAFQHLKLAVLALFPFGRRVIETE